MFFQYYHIHILIIVLVITLAAGQRRAAVVGTPVAVVDHSDHQPVG
jgi:hypothetical protein